MTISHFRSEIVHVWRNGKVSGEGPAHSAQMALDGVNYLTGTVGKISAQPLKAVTSWVADKTAPSYWRPNFDIIVRTSCRYSPSILSVSVSGKNK